MSKIKAILSQMRKAERCERGWCCLLRYDACGTPVDASIWFVNENGEREGGFAIAYRKLRGRLELLRCWHRVQYEDVTLVEWQYGNGNLWNTPLVKRKRPDLSMSGMLPLRW